CIIRNTNGTAPQHGIDFEPNLATQRLIDCVVRNTIIEGNVGSGIGFWLNNLSEENRANVTATIENCSLIGNSGRGLSLSHAIPGLTVRDSLFVDNGSYGVYQQQDGGSLNIEYSVFWNNTAGAVGGYAALGTGSVTTIAPIFASADPLSSEYRYLAQNCPAAITQGASDGGYMGARPKVAAPRIPGDANEDGKVNVGDLGILAANYGRDLQAQGVDPSLWWSLGDFNDDGKVNVGDLGILAANYGSSGSSFAADYAKVFDAATEVGQSDEDVVPGTLCSGLGLPMIAGFLLAGLLLIKLEE
ncbi:MAG: hypothetical protein GX629_04905, partial [Phycisphaerae bacterium]|nr:hypothetical protein [Phycisphaerae bacterium]